MKSLRITLQRLQKSIRHFGLTLLILAGVLALHGNTSLLHAQVAEICANGIDDDGDTLIDCDDPDCNFPFFSDGSYGNSQSWGVALGDLDGDGDLDAWVANNYNQEANRVWINQGGVQGGTPGTYADSGQALGIYYRSRAVALGDLDGDGDLDAWVAIYNQANRVWINQGGDQGGTPGTYADSGQALGNSWSHDVALGDLDGDGDLDAWVANGSNQANRVWINQGGDQGGTPGTYADSGQALGTSDSYGVALGDLDGDGDLDAWVANADNQANRVWINQGGDQGGTPGTYADSGQALGSSWSHGVALGDLDGDGDLDAWVANLSQANRVWINQGGVQGGTPGTYADSAQALGSSNSRAVALGDLDGDGDLDAWVANSGFSDPNRVWINQGGDQGGTPGTYADSAQALDNFYSYNGRDVALGDLDGDGDLDAWVANANQGNRGWINQGGLQGGTPGTYADSAQALGTSDSLGVALGDLDGDGDLDAWVANEYQGNRVWINLGGDQGGTPGTYADSGQALGNSYSRAVALGDLDGDGDLDAWVAKGYTNQVQANRVWINQGGDQGGTPGTYADSGQALGNSSSYGVALGDLDGDGDLDAWVSNGNSNLDNRANRVWINQGGVQGGTPGTYADSGQALGSSNSRAVALGDLDGDGDLDAWVANSDISGQASRANRVWINQGGVQGGTPGTYADSAQALGSSRSNDVALGDLDGDGDLDAWVANDGVNRVWINQGGDQSGTPGTYADSAQTLGTSDSYGVALGDLDGDGDLDAWVANFDQPNRVWINQGGAQLGTPGTYADSGQALGILLNGDWLGRRVALGDLDGDGDLDALVANDFSQANRVWINQISCSNDEDGDGIPNECDIDITLGPDCDGNGEDDTCQEDGDGDGQIDLCDDDLDGDGIPNTCDVDETAGADCDLDGQDDSCQTDTDSDGTIDPCDADIDGDGVPNACDIDQTGGSDCDADGQDDTCQTDTDSDGTIDPCDDDIDGDGFPNACDIDQTTGPDCDSDGQDDSCQTDTDSDGTIDPCDDDIDGDGILNECDLDQTPGDDCNNNAILDSCDIAGGAADANSNGIPDECEETPFIRGDVNGDGGVDIGDAIAALDYLFTGGSINCDDAADSNDDGAIDVADGIQILGYLFSGTGDLPAPFPTCGTDPTADALECEIYNGC